MEKQFSSAAVANPGIREGGGGGSGSGSSQRQVLGNFQTDKQKNNLRGESTPYPLDPSLCRREVKPHILSTSEISPT